MSETINKWIKSQIAYHKTDMSSVSPEIRFSEKENAIYLNSCAGLIRFTSRSQHEMEKFRNIFANKFSQAKNNKDFFKIYSCALKEKWSSKTRIKYKANLRTRLRMKVES